MFEKPPLVHADVVDADSFCFFRIIHDFMLFK